MDWSGRGRRQAARCPQETQGRRAAWGSVGQREVEVEVRPGVQTPDRWLHIVTLQSQRL